MKRKNTLSEPIPAAVIDIGTTAIRMTIAQITKSGEIKELDFLQQAVNLGKDTFSKGTLEANTIEECVKVIKSFKRILKEYGINSDEQIKAFATTAVRESVNRESFIDRIYIATGIKIETLDDVDMARLTYLSIQNIIKKNKNFKSSSIIAAEMGGGSTEILYLEKGNVEFFQTFKLGSLRLKEMLEFFKSPFLHQRTLMEEHIMETIDEIEGELKNKFKKPLKILLMGSDARFFANLHIPDWESDIPTKIPLNELIRFTENVFSLSVHQIVKQYHLSFLEAETLGPSLLFYILLSKKFKQNHIFVPQCSLRHGLLIEISKKESGQLFKEQILRSTIQLGKKYCFDEPHAMHTAYLSKIVYAALQDDHKLENWYELILYVASILHDIGSYINESSHHKHSMYLIQNSEIFGLNKKNILMVALISRYHRRSHPKVSHEKYANLSHIDRTIVSKLAAIIRIADALDRGHSQTIKKIRCEKKDNQFIIYAQNDPNDINLEEMAIKSKGAMFEEVYGMKVKLKSINPRNTQIS